MSNDMVEFLLGLSLAPTPGVVMLLWWALPTLLRIRLLRLHADERRTEAKRRFSVAQERLRAQLDQNAAYRKDRIESAWDAYRSASERVESLAKKRDQSIAHLALYAQDPKLRNICKVYCNVQLEPLELQEETEEGVIFEMPDGSQGYGTCKYMVRNFSREKRLLETMERLNEYLSAVTQFASDGWKGTRLSP